jgi:hypothetical protein
MMELFTRRVPTMAIAAAMAVGCGGSPGVVAPPASASALPATSAGPAPSAAASVEPRAQGELRALAARDTKLDELRQKQSEAKNTIGAIARGVVSAYERENVGTGPTHHFPLSAPKTPATTPKGERVQSSRDQWEKDPGWRDIRFEVTEPQRYSYESITAKDGKSVTVRAYGDLDGDGVESIFEVIVTVDAKGFAKIGELKTTREDE